MDERSVRGNLVTGLSSEDIEYLDRFEGDVSVILSCTYHNY